MILCLVQYVDDNVLLRACYDVTVVKYPSAV